MRVIAGSAKRLNLKTVPGVEIRPTTDRIKETLFNMLQWDLGGCSFLDLFSGSGGIGIEALSRGAKKAVFVEKNRQAVQCIEENLAFTKLDSNAEVITADAITALKQLEGTGTFDVIFMDPPYNQDLEKEVLLYLNESSLAASDTLLIIEALKGTDFSYLNEFSYTVIQKKDYKTNFHLFVKKMERDV